MNESTGKKIGIAGLILQLAPPAGFAFHFYWMMRSVSLMDEVSAESEAQLAAHLENAQLASNVGSIVGLIGLALIWLALARYKLRARWFFWWIVPVGILLLPAIPVGTLVGAILLGYILVNRKQFFRKAESA